MYRSQSVRICK